MNPCGETSSVRLCVTDYFRDLKLSTLKFDMYRIVAVRQTHTKKKLFNKGVNWKNEISKWDN